MCEYYSISTCILPFLQPASPFPMSHDLTSQTERTLNCYIKDSQNFIEFIFMGLKAKKGELRKQKESALFKEIEA